MASWTEASGLAAVVIWVVTKDQCQEQHYLYDYAF